MLVSGDCLVFCSWRLGTCFSLDKKIPKEMTISHENFLTRKDFLEPDRLKLKLFYEGTWDRVITRRGEADVVMWLC